MGSLWTDESAILRDLSFAQGRWVPSDIDAAVNGEKPPAHNVTEETEEEYFRHWTTDGDFSSGPDLMKIKKMLELMQDEEAPSDHIHSGPIEITKLIPKPPPVLNPMAVVYVPTIKKPKNVNPTPNKPRRMRNVAISSILALGQISDAIEPLKLCRPEDFIKPKHDDERESERVQDSVNKVSNWLQSQNITTMFKKKSSVQSLKNDEQRTESMFKVRKTPVQSEGSVESPPKAQGGQYIPSKYAEEYYKKAVDRRYMVDLVSEDVWGRAERLMKEIDEKKAEELRKQQELEAEALLAAEIEAAKAEAVGGEEKEDTSEKTAKDFLNEDKTEGIAHMLLEKHRHELFPGECVVCKVLTLQPRTNQDSQDIKAQPDTPEVETRERESITSQPGQLDTGSVGATLNTGCQLTDIELDTPVLVPTREKGESINKSPRSSVMMVDGVYQLDFSGFSNEIIIRKPSQVAEPEVTETNFRTNQIVLQKLDFLEPDEVTKSTGTPKIIPRVTETNLPSETKACIGTSTVNKQKLKPKHTFEQLLNSFDDFDDDQNFPEDTETSNEVNDSLRPSGLMRSAFLEKLNEENEDLRSTFLSDSDSYEDIDV